MSTAPNIAHPSPTDNPDALTRRVTSFRSFADLTDAPGYSPTLAGEDAEELELARLYDEHQARRGDTRRAYRGRPVRRG